MSAAFTPGPWKAITVDRFAGYAGDQVADLDNDILVVPPAGQRLGDPMADARLIAAVPELLAACVAALKFIDGDASCAPVLRAAIAKATGSES